MYTLESLIPDCVGRYITSGSGSVQLASLINGRTYAKVWQALVYWIVSQYEMGNSTNIAPLGVIARPKPAGSAASSSSPAPTFHFFRSFLEKHGLKLKHGEGIREDDLSTIRMNLSTLARLADVEPGTFRLALSHLFRRLGEVLAAKEQVLIDFSVGSLIGDKATVDFLFHHSTQEELKQEPKPADPRLLARSGRWRPTPARSLDNRALRARYPLDSSAGASSQQQQQQFQRVVDDHGREHWLDEHGQQVDPQYAAQVMQQQHEEEKEGAPVPRSTADLRLGRLVGREEAVSPSRHNALPNAQGSYQRRLVGREPLRNLRSVLSGTLPAMPQIMAPSPPPAESKTTSPFKGGRQARFVEAASAAAHGSPDAQQSRPAGLQNRLGSPLRLRLEASMDTAADAEQSSSSALARPASAEKQQLAALPARRSKLLLSHSSSLSNLPPVLDSFARTQAATYASEGLASSASARIASFLTPEACAWQIVLPSGKLVHTGRVPFRMDRLELTFEQRKQLLRQRLASRAALLPGGSESNNDDALRERGASKSLLRYDYYVQTAMDTSQVAPIKEEWVRNGLALLNTNITGLDEAAVEALVRENLLEIKADYLTSMKRAILDYVLRNENERQRLGIPVAPPRLPDWGLGESPARPPLSWRAPIQRAYRFLHRSLFRNNPAMLSLLDIWSKYEHLLLVDLPAPSQLPITVRQFEAMQKAQRDKVQLIFLNEWGEDVEFVFSRYAKEEGLTEDNSAAFFEAVATVCANQLRSIVERSAEKYAEFFTKYRDSPLIQFASSPPSDDAAASQPPADAAASGEDGVAPAPAASAAPIKSLTTITNPTWVPEPDPLNPVLHNLPAPVFVQKLLCHKLKDGSLRLDYETSLTDLEKIVLRLYEDLVAGLNDLPRVESKVFSLLEPQFLHLSLEGESGERIWAMKRDIASVFSRSVSQAQLLLSLYDDYHYLLDEEKKIAAWLKSPHSLPEYREQVLKYRATSQSLAAHTARQVRVGMLLCDCSLVNDLLVSKASDCSAQILSFLGARNIDNNISVCEKFKAVSSTLLKKPLNTRELVDLVKFLTQFKAQDRDELLRNCKDIKESLNFLYELAHPVGTDLLSHVGATWAWLLRIDSIVKESEAMLHSERNKMENKIEETRDTIAKQLQNYAQSVKQFETFGDIKQSATYDTAIHELQRLLAKAEEDIEALHGQEAMMGLTQTDFYQLNATKQALQPYETLWALVANWEKRKYEWIKGPVFKLDANAVEKEVEEMFRTAFKLSQQLSESAPVAGKVAEEIKRGILGFKPHVPLLHILANPGMRDRHWSTVSDIIQFELRPDAHTPLNRILEMAVEQHIDALSEVSEAASKEFAIEKAVGAMKEEWSGVSFLLKPWRDTGTHILLGDSVEEVQTLLDDHIVKTTTMKSSPYAAPFMEDIKEWERWLLDTQSIVDIWLKVQSAWMFQQPLFDSEDITRQMPSEGTMFKVVDSNWHKLMADVLADTKVYAVSMIPHLHGILKEAQALLDTIQAGLNQYLETKRLYFPRFWFLSDAELLEILSQTRDPLQVQPHLKKCFEGVHELEFRENLDIVAMHSKEGEVVPCIRVINPVDAKGAVERWLKEFELVMRDTVLDQCSKSLKAYTQVARAEWTGDWPGQVVLTVNQIHWTAGVTRALHKGKGGLAEFLSKSNAELQFIVMKVRGELSHLQRCTLGALVVIDVHARDVVEHLLNNQVSDVQSFEWQSQMRYYYEDDAINVRMITACQPYGFEYLGNSDRLVITALTDRCYRTLLCALQLNLGGAPEGPAGTGKTETTKDLAKACAIQCVVFNCSDGLDYMAMGKFFKGLASSGAWSCFDEFNRIDLEVLSVVAQQIQTIQRAKEMKLDSFLFEGTEIMLKPTAAVFITMNPGYAGRSELPDNLKAQFRSVAMMIPNYELIAQILLYSFGFVEASSLARKIVATYKLASEQLSSQDHYDYGMRAVRAVLTAAQKLKQQYPAEKEAVLLLRAISDVNIPKFVHQDLELFQGILSDLFPGVKPQTVDYGPLLAAVHDNIKKMNLQPEPSFVQKVMQLYETITVRHGLMLVGLTSCKSSCYKVLAAALTDLSARGEMGERAVRVSVLNPKSISSAELYGNFDPVSHEWSDGILPHLFRAQANDTSNDRKWLLFDGPVDAVWIENMNTVLDDNKKLCLNSGEIIHMSSSQNILFEVRDLAVASPATVSRCGMVVMEQSVLGWRCMLLSWLATLPAGFDDKNRRRVETLFEWLVAPCLRVVRSECNSYVSSADGALVSNLMRIFDSLLEDSFDDPKKVEEMGMVRAVTAIESIFLFALTWSIGASVDAEGRKKFDRFLREVCREVNHYKLTAALPKKGLVHEYVFSKDAGRWLHWSETLSSMYKIPSDADFLGILVPTTESARTKFLIETFLRAKKPALFIGPTGCGKSAYTLDILHALPKDLYDHLVIQFSAQTTAKQTQALIDDKVDRRRRGVYGPAGGKQCAIFVDDLNLPKREKYFAQPPIELLRQLLDSDGWYNVAEYQFRQLVDLQLLAAMGPPGGGRNPVTDRLLRHFICISLTPFEDATITHIFSSIMRWHFERFPNFAPAVQALTDKLVNATRDLYGIVTAKLLPTPAKTHYTYNLRDISRVFQGLCLSRPEHYEDPQVMIRLWVHECTRVFADRLVSDDDALIFLDGVKQCLKSRFATDFNKLMDDTADAAQEAEAGQQTAADSAEPDASASAAETVDSDLLKVRSLFFGSYMNRLRGNKDYAEVRDIKALHNVWVNYLEDYNQVSNKPMSLTLFRFALEHLSRIARILTQPGGHALLIGVGGSGKQSLTRLAASVLEYEVMSVELTKSFGVEDWHAFLRALLRKAGGEGKPTVLLINDSQLRLEVQLEDVNALLNSGQISNLWPADEWAEALELTRAEARKHKKSLDSQQALEDYFLSQCKNNLHIALAMSPVGSSFRERLRMFPSLVSSTNMSWFSAWPVDALTSVASDSLTDLDLDASTRAACVAMCQFFQKDVEALAVQFHDHERRQVYVTPTSYLELISLFKSLLTAKRAEVSKIRSRYQTGLDKLAQTEVAVKTMQLELEEMQPVLLRTSQETAEMMKVVEKETEEAQKIRTSVAKEEKIATEAANAAKAIEQECAADLSQAMPVLEAAIAALDTLTTAEISEIKAMRNPPKGVRLVLEALCVVMRIPPTRTPDPSGSGKTIIDYWGPSLRYLLSDPKLLRNLVEFDKDNIPAPIIKKIREFMAMPDFSMDRIKGVSRAAHSLCSWIYAIESYDRVVKQVMPKKEALKQSRAEYEVVKASLDAARSELAKVEGKIATLNANLNSMQEEKAELEEKMNQCSIKLERAHTLLSRLGGEKTRWTAIAAEMGVNYTNLTGDVLLSAGVIAYLGPFTSSFRSSALAKWSAECKRMAIPCSAAYSLAKTIGDPVQTRKWVIDGLPNDAFSIDNALILSKARRFSLMIDPQGQANRWIKNMLADDKLVVVKASDDYSRALENAIQFGNPVLMENVGEELDASLGSVLQRNVFKKGNVRCIQVGDSVIEYSDSFRLYMTTKLRNPHYLPETQVLVTLLNCMITPEGLQDQLLSLLIAKEKPDLENERSRLIVSSASNAARLKEIEDKILSVLSSSSGNILDDSSAIEILAASKVVATEIEEKQKVAAKTEQDIEASRMGYTPVAFHASTLFFCIADLVHIDPMYNYSLAFFQRLFHQAIDNAEFSHVLQTRITNLNDYFSYSLYTNVCRSLFSKDRLLFSLLLTARLLQSHGKIEADEWRFLLTAGVALDRQLPPNPASSWLSEKAWVELCRLSSSNAKLRGLHNDFAALASEWKLVYDSPEPHTAPYPGKYAALDSWCKLLILRCLRPDKVLPAARDFVSEHLGARFTDSLPFDLAASFQDSHTDTPIVFVLSPGSDPMAALLKFAADRGMSDKVSSISLGQGQGPIAAKMIEKGIKEGAWIVLQNCHLAPSWMPTLDRLCDGPSMKPANANPQFRLWLTSYPSTHFPVSILQSAVKLTTEAPDGLRQNLLDSYLRDPVSDESFFVSCKRAKELKALTFGLSFFHALVQERRSYSSLGFNISYGWNDSDFRISVRQLHMFLDEAGPAAGAGDKEDAASGIPFKALSYLIGEVNYGGRVTDDWDRRTLMALLEKFITPAILQPNYALSSSGRYVVPPDGPHQSYLDYIRTLPLTCEPEVFGLHENADITKDAAQTNALFASLLLTEAGSSSAQEAQKSKVLDDLSADILQKLPPRFDIEQIRISHPIQYMDSMSTVLVQECGRFNKLTDVIRSSLQSLRKALVGEVVMSRDLELLANSLFDGALPDMWSAVSYPSLKPLGSYVNDLVARLHFFQEWIEHDVPSLIPLPFLFFTQSYLTGVLQNYARRTRVPIDDVTFDFEFLEPQQLGEKPARPDSGAYIKGLWLEGARWDFTNNRLAESHPKVLFTPAPVIWLKPCNVDEIRAADTFVCPLYRTTARRGTLSTTGHSTNFVMPIRLPTNEPQSHWVQRGVALLCSLSD